MSRRNFTLSQSINSQSVLLSVDKSFHFAYYTYKSIYVVSRHVDIKHVESGYTILLLLYPAILT